MDLITIDNNVAIPSAYTMTILEFGELVSRDKTKGKNRASKELAYVYFMEDHRSQFAVYGKDERHGEVLVNVFGQHTSLVFEGELPMGESKHFIDASQYPAGAYNIVLQTAFGKSRKTLIIH